MTIGRRSCRRYFVRPLFGWWAVWDRLTDSVVVRGIDTRDQARREARTFNDGHGDNAARRILENGRDNPWFGNHPFPMRGGAAAHVD